ncbi:MAG: phytoene/squalene synthase family protein [Candidatus Saccharibacteria bacterium]|nr:phytoene/squalene synthase family protein [Candidatus Saccharibacteria bacterium]
MPKTTGKLEKRIFKKGSTTYYWSSRLFPKKYRDDVFALYSFVRTADDYVDEEPPQPKKLLQLEKDWHKAINDPSFEQIAHSWDDIDEIAIKHIVRLTHKYKFDPAWVQSFFDAMKQDIDHSGYANINESLKYVYGSAEVVGLMMARIMGVDNPENVRRVLHLDEAQGVREKQVTAVQNLARAQGRAMQWINFIRDVDEDNRLGRTYFPRNDLRKYNLKDLSKETARAQKADFERFMRYQLKRYEKWQAEADKGVEYIPKRLRSGLKTAVEMYNWTAKKIDKNPLIVFDKKIKPKKIRFLWSGTKRVSNKAARLFASQETPAKKQKK